MSQTKKFSPYQSLPIDSRGNSPNPQFQNSGITQQDVQKVSPIKVSLPLTHSDIKKFEDSQDGTASGHRKNKIFDQTPERPFSQSGHTKQQHSFSTVILNESNSQNKGNLYYNDRPVDSQDNRYFTPEKYQNVQGQKHIQSKLVPNIPTPTRQARDIKSSIIKGQPQEKSLSQEQAVQRQNVENLRSKLVNSPRQQYTDNSIPQSSIHFNSRASNQQTSSQKPLSQEKGNPVTLSLSFSNKNDQNSNEGLTSNSRTFESTSFKKKQQNQPTFLNIQDQSVEEELTDKDEQKYRKDSIKPSRMLRDQIPLDSLSFLHQDHQMSIRVKDMQLKQQQTEYNSIIDHLNNQLHQKELERREAQIALNQMEEAFEKQQFYQREIEDYYKILLDTQSSREIHPINDVNEQNKVLRKQLIDILEKLKNLQELYQREIQGLHFRRSREASERSLKQSDNDSLLKQLISEDQAYHHRQPSDQNMLFNQLDQSIEDDYMSLDVKKEIEQIKNLTHQIAEKDREKASKRGQEPPRPNINMKKKDKDSNRQSRQPTFGQQEAEKPQIRQGSSRIQTLESKTTSDDKELLKQLYDQGNQIESLKKQVKQKENEKQDLKKQLEKLVDSLEKQQLYQQEMEDYYKSIQEQPKENPKVTDLQEQNKKLRKQITQKDKDLEEILDKLNNLQELYQKEIQGLHRRSREESVKSLQYLKGLENENYQLKEQIEELQQNQHQQKSVPKQQQQEIKQLQEANEQMSTQNQNLKDQLFQLMSTFEDMEKTDQQLEITINNLTLDNEQLQKDFVNQTDQINHLSDNLQLLEMELERSKTLIEVQTQDNNILIQQNDSLKHQIQDLQKQLYLNQSKSHSDLENKINDITDQMENYIKKSHRSDDGQFNQQVKQLNILNDVAQLNQLINMKKQQSKLFKESYQDILDY